MARTASDLRWREKSARWFLALTDAISMQLDGPKNGPQVTKSLSIKGEVPDMGVERRST